MKISQRKIFWTFCKELSDCDNQVYIHSFPVLKDKNNGKTILVGELIHSVSEGTVSIKVYDINHDCIYAPFYNQYYGNYETLLDKCQVNINKELKRLGIADVNDYHI